MLVTGCAHCAFIIQNKWREIAGKLPFNIRHIAELIADTGPIKVATPKTKKRIGYQPACLLHRGLGVSANIPSWFGNPLPYFAETNNTVTCCGQAGITGFLYPKLANAVASRQIKSYRNVGINLLFTNCPWCNLIFDRQKPRKPKTTSLTEFIVSANIYT